MERSRIIAGRRYKKKTERPKQRVQKGNHEPSINYFKERLKGEGFFNKEAERIAKIIVQEHDLNEKMNKLVRHEPVKFKKPNSFQHQNLKYRFAGFAKKDTNSNQRIGVYNK